jgi:surface polysaccharide O-acyltransferase-like enzyme
MPKSTVPESGARVHREDAVDVVKGFAIFFVILNHCLARTSRKYLDREVTGDTALYFVNRLIHFAVPTFLFITCLLLTQSLLKNSDLRRYASARFRKTLVPYLLACFSYTMLYSGWPFLNFDSTRAFLERTISGQLAFHLYFTVVQIQVAVALPILVQAVRRPFRTLGFAILFGLILQALVLVLQREVLGLPRPGSFIGWYVLPITLGFTLALAPELADRARRHRSHYGWLALVSGVVYASVSAGLPGATSDMISLSFSLFSGLVGLAIYFYSLDVPTGGLRTAWATLGQISLPVFLVHPAVMHLLGGPTITRSMARIPFSPIFFWLATLGLSVLAGLGLTRSRIGRVLLGDWPKVNTMFTFR